MVYSKVADKAPRLSNSFNQFSWHTLSLFSQ